MIKVRMLKSVLGSPDGVCVKYYIKDNIFELPDSLAETFIKQKFAKNMFDEVNKYYDSSVLHETKMCSSPQNK